MNAKMIFRIVAVFLAASLIAGCVQQEDVLPQATGVETQIQSTPEPALPTPTGETVLPTEAQEILLTTEVKPSPGDWVVFIGMDGNVWVVNASSDVQEQITQDAWKDSMEDPARVGYLFPRWSTDGTLLAYERVEGEGTGGVHSMIVYQFSSAESKTLISDGRFSGFNWKPGTHLIAFGQGFDLASGVPSGDQAMGIKQIDADTGEIVDLIQPENGYQLYLPQWSQDGSLLSFLELYEAGKTGYFAAYDFESQTYLSWQIPVGYYSLSPDGRTLTYDNWYESPQGSTAIHVQPVVGGEDRQISPDIQSGFSFSPVFSPDGSQIAYLAYLDGTGDVASLYLIDAAGGEPREFGTFQNGSDLQWTADGGRLLMTRGPYDATEIVLVNTSDGSVKVLANGHMPD